MSKTFEKDGVKRVVTNKDLFAKFELYGWKEVKEQPKKETSKPKSTK